MKKLKLSFDDLKVESFTTTKNKKSVGTVIGQYDSNIYWECGATDGQHSCEQSCEAPEPSYCDMCT